MASALTVTLNLDARRALGALQELERSGARVGQEVGRALDERTGRRFAESLTAAENGLQRVGQAARRAGDELERSLRASGERARVTVESVGTRVAAIWGAVGGVVGGAIVGAFHKLGQLMREGAAALAQQEALEAKLAALARARGLAAEQTAQALSQQAEQLKQLTAFDDDAIRAAQVALLTYQNIAVDAMPRVTRAALDLAAALRSAGDTQVDLQGVARLLGRALEDPVSGMEALRRMGVVLDEQTKQYIRTLVEQGKVLQAQDVLLSRIEERVGGTAEAFAQSSAGIRELLRLTFADLEKELGRAFLQVQKAFAPVLTLAIRELLPVVSDIATSVAQAIVPVLQAVLPVVSQFLSTIGRALQGFVQTLLPSLTAFAQAATRFLAPLVQLVGALVEMLARVLAPVLAAVYKIVTPLMEAVAEALDAVLPALAQVLEEIGAILAELVEQVGEELSKLARELAPIVGQLLLVALRALLLLLRGVADVLRVIAPIIARVAQTIAAVLVPVLRVLREVVSWILSALRAAIEWTINFIRRIVEGVKAVLEWLGILKRSTNQQAELRHEVQQTSEVQRQAVLVTQDVAEADEQAAEAARARREELARLRREYARTTQELARATLEQQRALELLQFDVLAETAERAARAVERELKRAQQSLADSARALAQEGFDPAVFAERVQAVLETVERLDEARRRAVLERAQRERRELELEELRAQEALEEKRKELRERFAELGAARVRELEAQLEEQRLAIAAQFALRRQQLEERLAAELAELGERRVEIEQQIAQEIARAYEQAAESARRAQEEQLATARRMFEEFTERSAEAWRGFFEGAQDAGQRFLRAWMDYLLQLAENELAVAIFRATAQEVGSKGLLGLVTAAVAAGALKAAFAAMRSALKGFREGGWTGEGPAGEIAGVVHRREFVIPAPYAERWRPMLEEMRRGRAPAVFAQPGEHRMLLRGEIRLGLDDGLLLERARLHGIRVRAVR